MEYRKLLIGENLGELFAYDTETTGLKWWADRMFAFSVATPDGRSGYFDLRRTPKARAWISAQMSKAKTVVCHNVKFDAHFSRESGINIPPSAMVCTAIRASLIDEHLVQYKLDYLAKKYLKRGKVHVEDKTKMAELEFEKAELYGTVDAELALELYQWQEKEIEKQDLHKVVALERALTPHLYDQERGGILVDDKAAEKAMADLKVRIDEIQTRLDAMAGFKVNPNPSGSISQLFQPKQGEDGVWRAIDGTPLDLTDGGKPSFDADALKSMKHPAAAVILKVRKLKKARDTFLARHVLGHMDPKTKKVYPHINQTKGDEGYGTGTGRLSYNGPALQQIPSRDKEVAEIVRPIFLPDPGQDWVYGDLDQHEFRVFAHYTHDPGILEIYRQNPDADFHQLVADLTGLPRSAKAAGEANAKQVNLGIVFSMGAGLLAMKMGLPYTEEVVKFGNREPRVLLRAGQETLEVLNKYHAKIPGVKKIINEASSIAKSRGYVKTMFGRHIRFPNRDFAYKAAGLVYQGSSADLNKYNIINACSLLRGSNSRFLLNIHDEYSMSMDRSDIKNGLVHEIKDVIQKRPPFMFQGSCGWEEDRLELRVPIRIDFKKGSSWWGANNGEDVT